MNTLNKTFVANRTLKAAELNSIVSKINEIIANFPSDESSSDPANSVTEQDIIDKVNAAKAQLRSLIDEMNASIATLIVKVKGLEEGTNLVDDDEEFLKAIKQQCNIVLLDLNIAKKIIRDGEEVIVPAVDLGVLQQDVNTLNTLYAGLSALPGQVGLIANHFDEQGNPIYDGAAIIASINDNGDSTVGINADQILINGDTTLTGKLTSLDADIQNINVPDTATIANAVIQQLDVPTKAEIKEAVITDLEAGNVTITGDLHYNRIIGNTAQISTNTQLEDNAYFVQVTNNDYNNYITVTLPSNPITGQTIFIGGTKYYNLTANKQIHVYYREVVSEENYKQYLRTGVINVGES
jgi:hypothetical protein